MEKTCSISSIAKQAIRSDLEIYMLRTGRGSVVVQRKRDLIVGLSKNNDDFNFWAFSGFSEVDISREKALCDLRQLFAFRSNAPMAHPRPIY